MNDEYFLEQKAELIRLLQKALAQADALDLTNVAIRISEAIDILQLGRPSD